ncbi:ubiquinol-cytochrome C chaperone-domain-containing protein [Durotheca rogersii]|uniref:ubiquinol-cytochrome C chaperone-domain-containing protein n=1 Tax=Durotheca rogersii TaxID=419775 RepID=UPI00221F1B1E|nr:ubiquinol-cytochrome C chaperone-domain-containing protein [Durotheca rogersii]KAI5855578.1 ubiquinol-cytochrome C chaperone-domain-containing protein [Durotheca rogersii]
MACSNCRRQLALLVRETSALLEFRNTVATAQSQFTRPLVAIDHSRSSHDQQLRQRRGFASTPGRPALNLSQSIREGVGSVFRKTAEPYRVVQATETIYKACSREALYTISIADRKAGTIPKTTEGEDIGEGKTMWHQDFKLPPTFSTWSQITMLHMYLVFARLRNLERETARSWQRQLVDHYFFDAEEKMDLLHGINSRALRHRYLKDLFVQWRGVIAAYDEGVTRGDPTLASAVWRNVYKGRDDVDLRALAAIVSWMRLCLKMLDQIPDEALYYRAEAVFKWPAKNELLLVDKPTRELEVELANKSSPPAQKVTA